MDEWKRVCMSASAISRLQAELRIGKLEGDGVLVKRMLGLVLAFQVAILAKLFLH